MYMHFYEEILDMSGTATERILLKLDKKSPKANYPVSQYYKFCVSYMRSFYIDRIIQLQKDIWFGDFKQFCSDDVDRTKMFSNDTLETTTGSSIKSVDDVLSLNSDDKQILLKNIRNGCPEWIKRIIVLDHGLNIKDMLKYLARLSKLEISNNKINDDILFLGSFVFMSLNHFFEKYVTHIKQNKLSRFHLPSIRMFIECVKNLHLIYGFNGMVSSGGNELLTKNSLFDRKGIPLGLLMLIAFCEGGLRREQDFYTPHSIKELSGLNNSISKRKSWKNDQSARRGQHEKAVQYAIQLWDKGDSRSYRKMVRYLLEHNAFQGLQEATLKQMLRPEAESRGKVRPRRS